MTPATFFDTLRDRPGMIMMQGEHPLHRLEAFIEGLRWQKSLSSAEMTSALSLLTSLPAHVANVDAETGNNVGWFDTLLERNDYNEQRAFAEAIMMVKSIAAERGVI